MECSMGYSTLKFRILITQNFALDFDSKKKQRKLELGAKWSKRSMAAGCYCRSQLIGSLKIRGENCNLQSDAFLRTEKFRKKFAANEFR